MKSFLYKVFSCEDPYQLDAEHPDHALIWNIQLLSQLLQNVGAPLVKYADDLLICLRKCVHLKSKVASKHAAAVRGNVYISRDIGKRWGRGEGRGERRKEGKGGRGRERKEEREGGGGEKGGRKRGREGEKGDLKGKRK